MKVKLHKTRLFLVLLNTDHGAYSAGESTISPGDEMDSGKPKRPQFFG